LKIYGVDFTCAPRRAKPITVAGGRLRGNVLLVEQVEEFESFAQFESFLARPGPWVGGFDFPFGISREALGDLNWPCNWDALLVHCGRLERAEFKRILDQYRETRPRGNRYAKRRGDEASGAHPSVKLVNPPVGFMFQAGAPRLLAAGLHVPVLHNGDRSRVALEAYPGLYVRRHLGIREPYKSDDKRKHTSARQAVRKRILQGLADGQHLGIRVQARRTLAAKAVSDGSGDYLDAIICAAQASWSEVRRDANYGLPADADPVEGWIISA
jgi:hypothetical protein